jgi:membrane protein DedA with SNARE-associated domain/rhodanese-related sulfurtransferase
MHDALLIHAPLILFCWILANQGGVPAPAVPALLAAGTLSASGRLSVTMCLAIAVTATLCADLGWYGLGRWRGAAVLALLGRFSPNASTLIRRAQDAFLAHAGLFQASARALPEMNPIAAGLAGATGQSFGRFVAYGTVSAALWAGAWIGLGYLLGDAVMAFAEHFGIRLLGALLIAFVCVLVLRRGRRYRVLQALRRARISPDETKARIDRGEPVSILDARAAEEFAAAPYMLPGALWIGANEWPARLRDTPSDAVVVLYGRPFRRVEKHVGLHLRCAGYGRVRFLAGGLRAWQRRGYPVQMCAAAPTR